MSPVDRTTQRSPTIKLRLPDERLTEAARSAVDNIHRLEQESQDRCLQRYAEHYPQRFLRNFSADISQIENSIWKFAVSPFVAAWEALRTFYDAAGVQRAFIESQYDSAPFRLLYINPSASSAIENCPRAIPVPTAVTKGGRSDHRNIISEVMERLIAHLGSDLGGEPINKVLLNGDQIFTALFDVLTTQLKGRFWPEQYPLYQAELAEYIAPELEGGSGALYMNELFYAGYKWVLDFKEEIDIPEGEEPTGETQFQSIRETAQGPFASTCGVYAVLSLFESLGLLEEFKEQYNVHTYADLDRITFEFLKEHATYPEIMNPSLSIFRNQGMQVSSLLDLARELAQTFGINRRFFFRQIEIQNNLNEFFFRGYPNGFIAAIDTNVGPHAVHVLGYDRSTHMVRYYDPIGADGQNNVKELSLVEFNRLRIKVGEFAKVTVVEPTSN